MPLLVAAAPPPMSVAQFLGTVGALKAKGPLALFSPDVGRLKRTGDAALEAWQSQVSPPGRPRNACPPKGKPDLGNQEFLGMLEAVPVPQRATVSVNQAVTLGLNRRFACDVAATSAPVVKGY